MCTTGPSLDAEDVVTDRELADRCADGLDLSSQLAAENPPLRAEETGAEEAGEPRMAARNPQSDWVTVVAWILTRTSSSLGTGRSTSSSRSTSGGPYRSKTTALMRSLPLTDLIPTLDRTAHDLPLMRAEMVCQTRRCCRCWVLDLARSISWDGRHGETPKCCLGWCLTVSCRNWASRSRCASGSGDCAQRALFAGNDRR
jgi:hypothetical protein